MLPTDAERWNARYLSAPNEYLAREPHALVQAYVDQLPPGGLVLDMASGPASSGLFLVARGLRVIAVDISEAGLHLAQRRARELSLPLAALVLDAADPWLPPSKFDVILNFYFLSRPLFECYRRSLKPGGWLFFETFVEDAQAGGEQNYCLRAGELRSVFQDWEILHWDETWKKGRGGSCSSRRIARLVARKKYTDEMKGITDEILNP